MRKAFILLSCLLVVMSTGCTQQDVISADSGNLGQQAAIGAELGKELGESSLEDTGAAGGDESHSSIPEAPQGKGHREKDKAEATLGTDEAEKETDEAMSAMTEAAKKAVEGVLNQRDNLSKKLQEDSSAGTSEEEQASATLGKGTNKDKSNIAKEPATTQGDTKEPLN